MVTIKVLLDVVLFVAIFFVLLFLKNISAWFAYLWNKGLINGMYKFTTKGFQNNYYGNTATQNLMLSYKIKKRSELSTEENTENKETSNFGLSIFTGYYGEWLDKLKEDDVVDENSALINEGKG